MGIAWHGEPLQPTPRLGLCHRPARTCLAGPRVTPHALRDAEQGTITPKPPAIKQRALVSFPRHSRSKTFWNLTLFPSYHRGEGQTGGGPAQAGRLADGQDGKWERAEGAPGSVKPDC